MQHYISKNNSEFESQKKWQQIIEDLQTKLKNKENELQQLKSQAPAAPRIAEDAAVACVESKSKKRFKTEVVMFIPTPIPWADRRAHVLKQFLREKWPRSRAVLVFVFGTRTGPRLEEALDTSPVDKERVPGVDYFFSSCRDLGDEMNNPNGTSSTTCKVYEACKYIYENYEAEYVWRGADDSYVNLQLFFKDKPNLQSTRLFLGFLRKMKEVSSDLKLEGQPKLHELFGLYQYGQYMMGLGFVFSWDVVEFMATWSIPPHLTWCEDVMVGMWLNPFQITFDGSGLKYVRHYMTPELWDSITDAGVLIEPPKKTAAASKKA